MVLRGLPRSMVTSHKEFDQRDLHLTPEFERVMDSRLPGLGFQIGNSGYRGKIFSSKRGLRDKKTPTPGEHFERSSQLFLLINVGILEFGRNQTLKRTGAVEGCPTIVWSYPLVSVQVPYIIFKFFPSFETYFVTKEQQ